MEQLISISNKIPETEPKLRVYPNYVSINAAGVRLLGLESGDYIQINTSVVAQLTGRKNYYIGKPKLDIIGAYPVARRGRTMLIHSRHLSQKLIALLDGEGCYRICPEDKVATKDATWYNIFFKNYDKENTD
jgi:hypothetical protein